MKNKYINVDILKQKLSELSRKMFIDTQYEIGYRDAFYAIEKIIDKQSSYEKVSDWIHVNDRLPKPGVPVLALEVKLNGRSRYRLVQLIISDDVIDATTGEKLITWYPIYGGHCIGDIAYWMPLPKQY